MTAEPPPSRKNAPRLFVVAGAPGGWFAKRAVAMAEVEEARRVCFASGIRAGMLF